MKQIRIFNINDYGNCYLCECLRKYINGFNLKNSYYCMYFNVDLVRKKRIENCFDCKVLLDTEKLALKYIKTKDIT